MVWFKVDDNFADHPKVRRIPRAQRCAAIGLWTLAGTWSARHLRDGEVPDFMLAELAAKPSLAAALVRVDLWHIAGHECPECPPVVDGAYLYHDWTSCQPTKEKVEAERAATAERQRKAREKAKAERESQRESQEQSRRDDAVTPGLSQSPVPDPTRPGPLRVDSLGGERLEPLRAVPDTKPPTCSKHPNGDHDGPCAGCAKVRVYGDKLQAEYAREQINAGANCPHCHGTNWREDDKGNPTRKCDHRRAS